MNARLKSIFISWTPCKILRLVGGSFILAWGIQRTDWLAISLGAGFIVFGLFTTGCGSSGCSVPGKNNSN